MKKIYYILVGVLAMLFTACSPDDFTHPDQNGIPSAKSVTPIVTVDDSLNQVTFTLPAGTQGVMPVWYFPEVKNNPYSTVNGQKKIYAKAGHYTVQMYLMNANGMSKDYQEVSFDIKNSIIDYTKYYTLLCGGTTAENSKEWRMENETAGHFGCGEPGSTGTGWWSAGVDEKAGVGIYDNRLLFGGDNKYTFNPGAAGTMYVNCGVSGLWPEYEDASTDYNVPVSETTANYTFDVEGENLYIVLPQHTPFLYIPNTDFWANERLRVESMNANEVNLVSDNGSIAWHYTLTSKAGEVKFNGYNYEHEANIWRPIDESHDYTTSFWYAPGWSQIADPGFAQQGSTYAFSLPSATTEIWQAQCFIIPTSLVLNKQTNYDFSCIINSSTDNSHVTVKLTDKNDDGNYLFSEVVSVKAYEDYILYLTDLPGIDGDCKLVLDFGGNGDNCVVEVSRITLKDHAIDDGTVLPTPDVPEEVDWRDADNLLKDLSFTPYYYYAPGWSQIADPEVTKSGTSYKVALPSATYDQWQAQYHMKSTDIALSAKNSYDFKVTLNSTTDLKGATIKLTQDDDDNVFLFTERVDLTAYEDYTFSAVGLAGVDISNLKIVFDFGGNADNTDITISDMHLQIHDGQGETAWDPESADNLWENIAPNFFYYAPGWAQIADPVVSQNGRKFTISLPSATTDQWQAQCAFKSSVSTSASESYDFHCTLLPNCDMKGVTVKLVLDGDDNNFYFADRVDLKAYETYSFDKIGMAGIDMSKVNLFFDFGGNPDNAEIEVGDIILMKHK